MICVFIPSAVSPCATFANKIWNASRFVMMNLTIDKCELPDKLETEDKWILSKLNSVIAEVTDNMDSFELELPRKRSATLFGIAIATGILS